LADRNERFLTKKNAAAVGPPREARPWSGAEGDLRSATCRRSLQLLGHTLRPWLKVIAGDGVMVFDALRHLG
jgi:hypothetical protein